MPHQPIKHPDNGLGLKSREEPKQEQGPVQPFNPAKPAGSRGPTSRRTRKGRACVRLKQGELDTYTAELLGWVAGGCTPASWEALIGRKNEPGAPPWLNREALGLDDLSHRVLAISLAHLVHLQGGLETSPFMPGEGLDGGCLLRHLHLTPPSGVWELAQRLGTDSALRARGYLEVEGQWSSRRKRDDASAISMARFMCTDLSLSVTSLGALLGLEQVIEDEPDPDLAALVLPKSVRATLDRLLKAAPHLDEPFSIYLKGPEQSGRRTLANCLSRHFNRTLKPTKPSDGPKPGAFILVDLPCHFDEDDWNLIKGHPGWIFLRPLQKDFLFAPEIRADLVLDLGTLEAEERKPLWERLLLEGGPSLAACDPAELATLSAPAGRIIETVKRISRGSTWEATTAEEVQARLKATLGTGSAAISEGSYVEKLKPVRRLQELCLPADAMTRFQRIIQAIRGRKEMLANWNLDPGLVGRAQGVLLFHGPSGTGKTMAAEVLAHELGLPLWRMEAAEMESPFVGESEARLHSFFASVKDKPAVLLLDEADTVLMNRSETTGSTQHYQNNLVNTWLRELDRFEGILVLTTNHANSLDPAVERRIQFRMGFESPTATVRAQIWTALLGEAPIPGRDTLDLPAVAARYPLSGGRIRNAFVDACQRAAEVGAISQELLLAACDEELQSALIPCSSRMIRGFAAHSKELP